MNHKHRPHSASSPAQYARDDAPKSIKSNDSQNQPRRTSTPADYSDLEGQRIRRCMQHSAQAVAAFHRVGWDNHAYAFRNWMLVIERIDGDTGRAMAKAFDFVLQYSHLNDCELVIFAELELRSAIAALKELQTRSCAVDLEQAYEDYLFLKYARLKGLHRPS